MSSTWAKPWLYPLLVALSLAVWLLTDIQYPHPQETFLHARYARNLIDGAGLVYTPGERVLLSPSVLPMLTEAALAPLGDGLRHPSGLIGHVLLALSLAGWWRQCPHPWPGMVGAGVLLLMSLNVWGGVGLWVAALTLLLLDDDMPYNALWGALLLLVTPLGLLLMVGIAVQRGWRARWVALVSLPALAWWAFAFAYYNVEGLSGLGLALIPPRDDFGLHPLALLAFLPAFFVDYRNIAPSRAGLLIWSLSYVGAASLLGWLHDPHMLTLGALVGLLMLWEGGDNARWGSLPPSPLPPDSAGGLLKRILGPSLNSGTLRPARWGGVIQKSQVGNYFLVMLLAGVIVGAGLLSEYAAATLPPRERDIAASVGLHGTPHEAFYLAARAYHLNGRSDPHLRALHQRGDQAGIILATAPDVLVGLPCPFSISGSLATLDYQGTGQMCWRSVSVGEWREAQALERAFGPDLTLTHVALDQERMPPGAALRVRLDWSREVAYIPPEVIVLRWNLLDVQDASWGTLEERLPPERFAPRHTTTYHALRLADDAPTGAYTLRMAAFLRNGRLGEHWLGVVVVPVPPPDALPTTPPLGDLAGQVTLLAAEVEQMPGQWRVHLMWRAETRLDADYSIFVHLTPPDDAIPLAQGDDAPLDGRYPTRLWATGEVVADRFDVPTLGLPPGDYVLRVGLFNPQRGRLGEAITLSPD